MELSNTRVIMVDMVSGDIMAAHYGMPSGEPGMRNTRIQEIVSERGDCGGYLRLPSDLPMLPEWASRWGTRRTPGTRLTAVAIIRTQRRDGVRR